MEDMCAGHVHSIGAQDVRTGRVQDTRTGRAHRTCAEDVRTGQIHRMAHLGSLHTAGSLLLRINRADQPSHTSIQCSDGATGVLQLEHMCFPLPQPNVTITCVQNDAHSSDARDAFSALTGILTIER